MKSVTSSLATYLNTQKQLVACDLYTLTLHNGNVYRYADFDVDVVWDGHTYAHDALIIRRQQTKLNPQVNVDTMTFNIYSRDTDMIESTRVNLAAHSGVLDKATMSLSRCFFSGTTPLGVIDLFTGVVEVKQCGGLNLQLTAKAKTSGLNMEFPLRKYYPQGSFETVNNTITSSTDEAACVITPFIPLREVLM